MLFKTKFFITVLLALSFSVSARDLTVQERLVLSTYERTEEVFNFAIDHIDTSLLSWSERLSFSFLRRSCRSLEQKIEQILRADNDYPDQSSSLSRRYLACSEGTLSLTKMFIDQY